DGHVTGVQTCALPILCGTYCCTKGTHPNSLNTSEFFSSLLKQIYLDQQYVPHTIYVPVDFDDREELEELLTERNQKRVHILVPRSEERRVGKECRCVG